MKRMLILYGTSHGHTLKIATFIADVVRVQGWSVDLVDTNSSRTIKLDDYAAVIAGASVRASNFPRTFRKFVSTHKTALAAKPTAFFSVCLGILQTDDAKVQTAEKKIISDFFAKTEWWPDVWTIFAGALSYSKYGWLTRLIMKRIAKRAGRDTDIRKDYEYTNWSEVRRFVSEFLASLEALRYAHDKMTESTREWVSEVQR